MLRNYDKSKKKPTATNGDVNASAAIERFDVWLRDKRLFSIQHPFKHKCEKFICNAIASFRFFFPLSSLPFIILLFAYMECWYTYIFWHNDIIRLHVIFKSIFAANSSTSVPVASY